MKNLASVDLNNLLWKQMGLGARNFELRAGDDLVAVIYWPKLLSDRAVARSAAGIWQIDRLGFFRQRIVVSPAGSDLEIASFEPGWLGDGDLVLTDGRVFQWYRTKALGNAWALADQDDNLLFEVHEGMRWFKHEADVVLHVAVDSMPELLLLILTTWYLAFAYIQDSAAVVAATTAAVC
jgi:hypothetical protein